MFPRHARTGCFALRAPRPWCDSRPVPRVVPRCKPGTGARGSSVCKGHPRPAYGRCVRILFDANTPAPLAGWLKGHQVTRADELEWQGLENGDLLDSAEQAGFEILLTCDQNVRYQQNFSSRKLAVVILSTNHWPSLKQVADRVAKQIDFVRTGQVVRIDIKRL